MRPLTMEEDRLLRFCARACDRAGRYYSMRGYVSGLVKLGLMEHIEPSSRGDSTVVVRITDAGRKALAREGEHRGT